MAAPVAAPVAALSATVAGPEHGSGDGRRLVATPAVKDVRQTAGYVIPRAEGMLVHGPIGTGRSTAVKAYLQEQALPWHWLDLSPGLSAKQLDTRLLRQVATDDVDLPQRDVQDDLVDALAAQPRILVIRHAERLTTEAAGELQWLHDRPDAAWSLILIGNETVGTAIHRDPLLANAITGTVRVGPLKDRNLLSTLQSLHPLFLTADPQLLIRIDDKVCHGNLGHWTRFLDRALALHHQHQAQHTALPDSLDNDHPRLDVPLAKATLQALRQLPQPRR
ncbi:AAA family ATPase [Nocardioides sambongensis]|uniref:AAA family ATPase n=1 Tax=Nocardioides sambongensis TaxID=2589074 RepID=UPI0011271C3A|nr:AAA family ATPase [Nocardioides sambongensis]